MSFSSIGLQPAQLTALRVAVSADRLAAYDTAVGGNGARAVDLYGWNAAVSAALFEDFSVLEVVLRNACHRELRIWNAAQGNSSPWYHHPVLTPGGMQDIGRARQRVAQGGKPGTEGRVISELMFGFWRLLHSKIYEATLWTPCLRHAYPLQRPNDRSAVYHRLDRLNTVRNRVAHHEPIHGSTIGKTGLDIAGIHNVLLEILGWIDIDVQRWVTAHSRVPTLLRRRP
ncbi:MAG: hypothetical protein WBV77_07560 [Solirubrobacteraceae bacterium]